MTTNGVDWRTKASRFATLLGRAVPLSSSLEEAIDAVDAAMAMEQFQRVPNSSRQFQTGAAFSMAFAHDIFDRRAQGVLNDAMKAVKEMSAAARRDLRDALNLDQPAEMASAVVRFISRYRTQLSDLLGRTNLASLLQGARAVASQMPPVPLPGVSGPPPPSLPPDAAAGLLAQLTAMPEGERWERVYELPGDQQEYVGAMLRAGGTAPPLPPFTPPTPPAGSPEEIHFPIIEEAVKNLSERNVVSRYEYDRMDAAARQKAFTIANTEAHETLAKVRDALAENVAEGADLETFRAKVLAEVEPNTFLSPAHLETVWRTNIQTAFSDGKMAVLSHPFVREGFPYAAYNAIHDDRVRHEHLELEKLGIDGTNLYRIDDPVFQTFRPAWDFNCRCNWTPTTIQHAAEQGLAEAKRWIADGVEPSPPAFVPMPPFRPPSGFDRSLSGAPLSIRLSLLPMELDAAFGLDAQGNWHGPTPPSEGWVEIGKGPKGGKVWKNQGGAALPQQPPATRREPNWRQGQKPTASASGATQPPAPAGSPPPAPREEVKKRLEQSPFRDASPIDAGNANLTFVLTLKSGDKGVWKPAAGEHPELTARVGGPLWRREVASSAVAAVLGLGDLVPPTVYRREESKGGEGSLQFFVRNAVTSDKMSDDVRFGAPDDMARAAAFDFLALNLDRHGGNWMLTPDAEKPNGWRIYLIDNGLCFGDTHDEPASDAGHTQFLHRAVTTDVRIPQEVAAWKPQRDRVQELLTAHGLGDDATRLAMQRFDLLVDSAGKGETFGQCWAKSGITAILDMPLEQAAGEYQAKRIAEMKAFADQMWAPEEEKALHRHKEEDAPSRQAARRAAIDKEMDDLMGTTT